MDTKEKKEGEEREEAKEGKEGKEGKAICKCSHLIKVITLGESGVGKSSLIKRFADQTFDTSYITTIGIDFKNRILDTKHGSVAVQIWDTAGQERFRSITQAYYRNVDAIIFAYDLGNYDTFALLKNWYANVKDDVNVSVDDLVIILVGNKFDREIESREVAEEEAKEYATSNSMMFFETSAKDGHNINHMFNTLAVNIVEKRAEKLKLKKAQKKTSLNAPQSHISKLSSCCK